MIHSRIVAPVWRFDVLVAAVGAGLLMLWDMTGWDLSVIRAFGSATGFPQRDGWLLSGVLHQGGRVAAWLVFIALFFHALRRSADGVTKTERWAAVLATALCMLLVPAIKQFSLTSCPWDLAEFGGTAHIVSHWSWGVADGGAGHCFPSGHAVAAFGFFSLYFMWRRSRPTLAMAALSLVCVAGALFGWAQVARGAHYPSHVLWSAWLCWVIGASVTCVSMRQSRLVSSVPVAHHS